MLVVVVLVLCTILAAVAVLLFMPSETYIYDFEAVQVVSEEHMFSIDSGSEDEDDEIMATQTQNQESQA